MLGMELAEFQRRATWKWWLNTSFFILISSVVAYWCGAAYRWPIIVFFAWSLPTIWIEWRRWQRIRRSNEVPTDRDREIEKAKNQVQYATLAAIFMPCFFVALDYQNYSRINGVTSIVISFMVLLTLVYSALMKLRRLKQAAE
jgi:hypothetical protein